MSRKAPQSTQSPNTVKAPSLPKPKPVPIGPREWDKPYPEVQIGDMVWFYHGTRLKDSVEAELAGNPPTAVPQAAIVTEVASMGLRLAMIPPDQPVFRVIDDIVRHRDDPSAYRMVENDPNQGVWECTPWHIPPSQRHQIGLLLKVFRSEIEQFDTAVRKLQPKTDPDDTDHSGLDDVLTELQRQEAEKVRQEEIKRQADAGATK